MLRFKIGPKVRMGARSVLTEAPADDPIYTRGYAIGGITARRTSAAPEPPDDLEVQAFQDYEQALSRSLEEKVKELPSSKPDLSPFELEAHKSYESAMWDRFEQATGNKRPADAPKSPGKDEDE